MAEFSVTQTLHHGPLPDPDTLAQYERMMPGAAERIFRIAEREQEHRHAQEKTSLEGEIAHQEKMSDLEAFRIKSLFSSNDIGGRYGLYLALFALSLAAWSIYFGASPWVTAAFLGFPVAAMIETIRSGARPRKLPGEEESQRKNPK